eukprot:TRINITY_DN12159_c0_g1_i1.p1 TRINITY_DN12159_c0_g1~~TRINITY_DN12159_c0_g1_i1.p1  ORF type:complete len:888 (+),score=77.43 TRINITY_DN12159_c0_g1_i1:170-2665(+)
MTKYKINFKVQCKLWIISILLQTISAQRQTISGDECVFPTEVGGVVYDDCVPFADADYCRTADDIWSPCAPPTEQAGNTPEPTLKPIATSTPFPPSPPPSNSIFTLGVLQAFQTLGSQEELDVVDLSPSKETAPVPIISPVSETPVQSQNTQQGIDSELPSIENLTPVAAPRQPVENGDPPSAPISSSTTPSSLSADNPASIPIANLPSITSTAVDLDAINDPREVGLEIAAEPIGDLRINEVMVGRGRAQSDWFEIFNSGNDVVNIAGWKIRDKNSSTTVQPQEFVLGEGDCSNIIGLYDVQPGSFLKLTSGNQCSFSFGFGENDGVYLINPNDKVVDSFVWKEADITPGTSFARFPDGAGEPIILGEPTPGFGNEPATGLDLLNSCCSALAGIGFSSNLPTMIIDTRNREIPDEPKIDGVFMCTCSGEQESEDDYSGFVGIEIRGQTSARDFEKKSFSMEIRDAANADADFGLLGLPSEEDFVLYGPEEDRSLGLKNIMAYEMSRAIGQYASRYRLIEIFLVKDGQPLNPGHYHGVYVLGEKIKKGQDRVDIQDREGEDLTGGYIMKHDNNNVDEGEYWFNTTINNMPIIIVYPRPRDLTEAEASYIMGYLDEFEAALASKQFRNAAVGYRAYIDIDTFVDYMLVVEATKNPDGYRGSCYMHKDRGGPLRMGPIWDYNEAFGTCCGYPFEGYDKDGVSDGISGGSAISIEGWRFNICEDPERCIVDPQDGVSMWYRRMWQDVAYRQLVAKRWQEVRTQQISDAWVEGMIEGFRNEVADAAMRNYQRWGDVIGEVWFDSYEEQWTFYVDRLKEWLIGHMQWMDNEFTKYE